MTAAVRHGYRAGGGAVVSSTLLDGGVILVTMEAESDGGRVGAIRLTAEEALRLAIAIREASGL